MQQRWQVEPNGDLSTTTLDVRVVIRDTGGFIRFLLLRRSHSGSREGEMLLESGSEIDVGVAKAKAVLRAEKLVATRNGPRQ
jgi:hypothetical protein